MIRKLLSIVLFLAGMVSMHAQTPADSLQKNVSADPRLQTLVNKHVEVNTHVNNQGYRVQIYFGADKAKAKEMKAKFLAKYADEANAYEVYEVPNFKIRVGNFRTRLDAYAFLKEIRNDFPQAFIVESEIEYSVSGS